MRTAAIILAGGQGSRLGGVRKADLEVGGERLLDRVLDAVAATNQRIVVGYEDLAVPPGVILTREEPPGSGPAAGVAAGVGVLDADIDWVLTLACDLPGVAGAVPALLDAAARAGSSVDSISASADPGHTQWLVSIHRTHALRQAIAADSGIVGGSMRRLYSSLRWENVTVPPASTKDIDTWEEFEQWQAITQVERT